MTPLVRRWLVPVLCITALASGCVAGAAAQPPTGEPLVRSAPATAVPQQRRTTSEPPVTRAREGRPAASERVRFRPHELILNRGGSAAVEPASTVDGELQVPENVRHLGWWDGGAYAGDPFGSTVIAGHVDSRTQGLGFFARLLRAEVGDQVVLRGEGHRQAYRVTAIRTVTKQVLASAGEAFDQAGGHRLVLITCTGNYDRDRGGYDSNLVIYAEPEGLAR